MPDAFARSSPSTAPRRAVSLSAALALGVGLLVPAGLAAAHSGEDVAGAVPSLSIHADHTGASAPTDVPASVPDESSTASDPRLPACSFGTALTGPRCGVWWGIYARPPEGSGDWYQGLRDLETSVGREFDLVYRFYDWDATIPDAYQMRAAEEGRMLRINITAREYTSNTFTPWSDIADGTADAQIRQHARSIKNVPQPVYLSFQQEPEPFVGTYGTVEDFAGAWRRIHYIFEQEGVTNVVWTWNVTGSSSRFGMYLDGLYPGDRWVDWVSWDPYNFFNCHGAPWETFDQTIGGFYTWAMENGFGDKPFMLSEYGSTRDPADLERRASWLDQSIASIRSRPNIKAVVYFNSSDSGPVSECDVRVTGDRPTLDAFRTMGEHPYVNQPHPIDDLTGYRRPPPPA